MIEILSLILAAQTSAMPSAGANIPAPHAPLPRAEAVGSANFLLAQPRVRPKGVSVRVEGSICRRPNRSLTSPSRVQIDHLAAGGELVDTSYAYVPRLSQREDQRCGRYAATLKSSPQQAGETVRVCLPQSRGACQPPR